MYKHKLLIIALTWRILFLSRSLDLDWTYTTLEKIIKSRTGMKSRNSCFFFNIIICRQINYSFKSLWHGDIKHKRHSKRQNVIHYSLTTNPFKRVLLRIKSMQTFMIHYNKILWQTERTLNDRSDAGTPL